MIVFVLAALPTISAAAHLDPADLLGTPIRDHSRPGPNREPRHTSRAFTAARSIARGFLRSPQCLVQRSTPGLDPASIVNAGAGDISQRSTPPQRLERAALLSLPPPA